jgi:hypothetical protein
VGPLTMGAVSGRRPVDVRRGASSWGTGIRSSTVLPRLVTCLVVVMSGCTGGDGGSGAPPSPTTDGTVATSKFLTYSDLSLELVPGEYVVVFDSGTVSESAVPALVSSLVAGSPGVVQYEFTKSLRGFVATNLTDDWAQDVSERNDVSFVRKNFRIYGNEQRGNVFAPVPWNLDRVDQRAPFSLDRDYRFKTGGLGASPPVPVYILDNGVYRDHLEFASAAGSRVENVADLMNTNFARCSLPVADANHGTRVASIAAGTTLGITPTLIKNVKVMDRGPFGNTCIAGSASTVLMGLEETYRHMVGNGINEAVVNLSLGWSAPTPDVAAAIERLQQIGALVVAAGGNEDQDASGVTPANLPDVLAVGATNISDSRAIFSSTSASNYGSTIALWAPGSNILGADWPMVPDPRAKSYASGTSDAAPHVSGAAALRWQQNPSMTASQVMSALRGRATLHMLADLGSGSVNALLYVGEDAPSRGQTNLIPRTGDGDLQSVRIADSTRIYVAGGDLSGVNVPHEPYSYAGYDVANLTSGPVWKKSNSSGLPSDCFDVEATRTPVGGGTPGELAFLGCMGTNGSSRQAMVLATQQDGLSIWPGPAWLGLESSIGGVTGGLVEGGSGPFIVAYAIATRPTVNGSEVFVTSFDGETGQQVASRVLTAPGFTEQFHRGVDLVLVDVAPDATGTSTSTELVAATYSDPPGPDKTFLWKVDSRNLQVQNWKELPAPPLAPTMTPPLTANGIVATALAVQRLEVNGTNIMIPGEVFLATEVVVSSGSVTSPWAYIYRLNPDRVSATSIEVVKDARISSLWSEDGDLFFAGMTTRVFPPGNLVGVPKPGVSFDYDAFLGKSEGVYNRMRWILTYDSGSGHINTGYGTYGLNRAYIVGSDSNTFYVVEYLVY